MTFFVTNDKKCLLICSQQHPLHLITMGVKWKYAQERQLWVKGHVVSEGRTKLQLLQPRWDCSVIC